MNANIKRLTDICDAATDGPWVVSEYSSPGDRYVTGRWSDDDDVPVVANHTRDSDAEFIATFDPKAVRELLKWVDDAKERLESIDQEWAERDRCIADIDALVERLATP